MTHEELKDLIPALALDALEGEELHEARAHVDFCGECAAILAAHGESAAMLALTLPPSTPPPGMRERILGAAALAPAPAPARRTGTPRLRLRGLALGAASLVVAGLVGYNLVVASRLADERQMVSRQRQVLDVLGSRYLDTISMSATGDAPHAGGQIFVAERGESAAVVMSGLPDPGGDVYQLWLVRDGRPQPVRAFRPDPKGMAVIMVPAPVDPLEAFVVTLEERAGEEEPRGPQILRTG